MTKEEVLKRVKDILAELKTESSGTNFTDRTSNALSKIINFSHMLMREKDSSALLGYLILILQDSNFYNQDKACGFVLRTCAEMLLDKHHKIADDLSKLRAAPPELIQFILELSAPTLKEQVSIRGLQTKDNWLDPITSEVMDYPVSYAVNGVEQQPVDLFTLINNSENCIALQCPFTKQPIFLKDLKLRSDIVEDIRAATFFATASEPLQISLAVACKLVREDKLEELKVWYLQRPHVDLDAPIKDRDNQNWTLLHNAFRTGNFKIASWLIENGADVGIKNASDQTPFDLVNFNQLKLAAAREPESLAFKFLLYRYYVNSNTPFGILNAVGYMLSLADSKYPPYCFWAAVVMLGDGKHSVPVDMINSAIEKNFARGMVFLSKLAEYLGENNPSLYAELVREGTLTMPKMLKNFKTVLALSTPVAHRSDIELKYAQITEGFSNKEAFKHVEYNHMIALCFANLAWRRSGNPEALELLKRVCRKLKFDLSSPNPASSNTTRLGPKFKFG